MDVFFIIYDLLIIFVVWLLINNINHVVLSWTQAITDPIEITAWITVINRSQIHAQFTCRIARIKIAIAIPLSESLLLLHRPWA